MKIPLAVSFIGIVLAVSATASPISMPCDETMNAGAWRQPGAVSDLRNRGSWSNIRKKVALVALRQEALRIQAADGGTLTEAHRTELQAQLDAIRSGRY